MNRLAKILIVVAFALLFGTTTADGATVSYACTWRGETKPTMDGRLDNDPFWQSVPLSDHFRSLNDEATTQIQTSWFQFAYTTEALYIAVWCSEPNMDKLQVNAKPNGTVWKDDGVEIFLATPAVNSYFHFIVNTAATRYTAIGRQVRASSNWQAACFKGKDFFSFEIALPYTTLLTAPSAGTCWVGNITRNHHTDRDYHSSWAPLHQGFHDPSAFAPYLFEVGVDNTQARRRLRDMRQRRLANEVRGMETVAESLHQHRFQFRAQILRSESAELRHASKTADDTALPRVLDRANTLSDWGWVLQKQLMEQNYYRQLESLFDGSHLSERSPSNGEGMP